MEFCAVVMILCPFKPMYPLEYIDMDTGNTGDYHAPHILSVIGKKGNRTEPNRTTGLYRTAPTEISDSCGTGFYRAVTEPNQRMRYFVPI